MPAAAKTVKGYEVRSWIGLAAPRGTTPEIIEKLNAQVRRALTQAETRKRHKDLGNEVRATSPDELKQHIESKIENGNAWSSRRK